jgi:DNA-nicking Smr family endonuclease
VSEPPFVVEESGETIAGRAPDVSRQILRELRTGERPSEGQLDLHGRLLDEALAGVARFVGLARGRGARVVTVIHGRGRNSDGGDAVLRPAIWRWLASPGAARAGVAAFTSVAPRLGGAGATAILLRR